MSTPSVYARRAIEEIRKANHAAILAGMDFLSREEEAEIIDRCCPFPEAMALLARQRNLDTHSPAARELEQKEIDREAVELGNHD